MQWLVPSVIATMTGTMILTVCYFYLYTQDKKNYLKIWSFSWVIYSTRYIFMLGFLLWQKNPFFLIGNQLVSLISGILLLYGSYKFINKKFPHYFIYISVACAVWIFVSILNEFSFIMMSLPTFSFLAFIYIWTGFIFYSHSKSEQKEATIVGISFIIWGIHKADYPFLRPVTWFAPWGYLISAVLEFTTALGLLIVYFRKTRNEMIANQKRLTDAQRIAQVGDWTWDIETNELIVSKETYHIFGLSPDTVQPTIAAFENAIHPDDYDRVVAKKDSAFSQQKGAEIEFRIILPNGEIRYVQSITSIFIDDNSRVNNFVGTIQDVTERKKAEIKLKDISHLLMNVTEGTTDAIFVKDIQGKYLFANSATCKALGKNSSEIIGKTDKELFPEASREVIHSVDSQVIRSGKPIIAEENLRTSEGDTVWLTNKSPYLDEKGDIIGLIGISRNITPLKNMEDEKKKLEYQLTQAQKIESIGNLAGGIAHDFNNILFPIIGLSELLLEDLPEGSPEYENVMEIFTAGKRGSDLVKQILAFSRQSENKLIPTRIQQVLKDVIKLCRASIPTDIEIHHKIQSNCGFVLSDSTQIHQIAMNLITNAYHAIGNSSGKISVQLKEAQIQKENLPDTNLIPGLYAVLTISDTGCGISPEIINRIFEPYFTTKEQGKGTGLGLAVVHGIIKKHGGEITVQSEFGKGTIFNVYLPIMEKPDGDESIQRIETLPTGNERILLVDDEEPIARLEKQILERLGYHVTVFNNSKDALRAFRSDHQSFDLIISDMTMPSMTGDQLARDIIAIRDDIPIIICTGFSERMNEEKAQQIGIKGLLMKPVVKADIAKEVRRVLDIK